ncbi:MAG: hypothetical protein AB1765_12470 [Candidatus Hydrogenedentota bacterium]
MEKGIKSIIIESLVRALTWGITLAVISLITLNIMLGMINQRVKNAIDFSQKNAIRNVQTALLNAEIFPKIKQNVKEAIEYSAQTTDRVIVSKYLTEKKK